MKENLKSKGYISQLIADIGIAAALIAYGIRGGDVLSSFAQNAEICLAIALIAGVVIAVKPLPLLEYVPFILTLCALGIYLRAEMDFIANVYTALDGNSFDVLFWIIAAGFILAIIAGIVSITIGTQAEPAVQVMVEKESEPAAS